jgi:putative transposase
VTSHILYGWQRVRKIEKRRFSFRSVYSNKPNIKGESAMKLEMTISEVTELFKEIQKQPDQLFAMIRTDIRETVGRYLTTMMNAELTQFLGRNPYKRCADQAKVNHRNGVYPRGFTLKGIGEVKVKIPRDRKGDFKNHVTPWNKQFEKEISRDVSLLFLTGVSTRSLSMISERLIGRHLSHTEIGSANKELSEAVEKWRRLDLSGEIIKYIFVDGVTLHMRIKKNIDTVPVLVAIGVTEKGYKLVLSFQSGDKDTAGSWREFFKDLKSRGLNSQKVVLGVMDGLPGLESIFKEEFPGAKVQRCQVHVARNYPGQSTKETSARSGWRYPLHFLCLFQKEVSGIDEWLPGKMKRNIAFSNELFGKIHRFLFDFFQIPWRRMDFLTDYQCHWKT